MVLANVGLVDLMWTMLVIFFMVTYWMIMFRTIIDVFRRDASGANKAMWLIFLLVFPFVALIAYLISNGQGMTNRQVQDAQAAQQAYNERIREVAGAGPAQEIAQAKSLLDSGAISQAEYDSIKAKALA